jgi:CRP/FNR family transcriptional regulator, nitrogen fixation regulation protein
MPPVDFMHNDRRASSQTPLDTLTALAAIKRYRRGEEIYSQHDPVAYQYRVVSGAARRLIVQASGRRRIVDFLLPGDFFGFARRREHAFTVEAVIEDTDIALYPRARVDKLVGSDPGLGHLVCEATAAEICRLQERIVVLGQTTALERVTSFLIEMAGRLSDDRGKIVLPMSRYDIADYLALSVETVCRALGSLKHRGAITLAGSRRVQILDRAALDHADDDDDAAAHPAAAAVDYRLWRNAPDRGGAMPRPAPDHLPAPTPPSPRAEPLQRGCASPTARACARGALRRFGR